MDENLHIATTSTAGAATDWGEVTITVVFMVLVGALVLAVTWQLLGMARDRARHPSPEVARPDDESTVR